MKVRCGRKNKDMHGGRKEGRNGRYGRTKGQHTGCGRTRAAPAHHRASAACWWWQLCCSWWRRRSTKERRPRGCCKTVCSCCVVEACLAFWEVSWGRDFVWPLLFFGSSNWVEILLIWLLPYFPTPRPNQISSLFIFEPRVLPLAKRPHQLIRNSAWLR